MKDLTKVLVTNGYKKGGIDKTMFVKGEHGRLMITQIYVLTLCLEECCTKWSNILSNKCKKEFEMSLVGELTYFLGL